MEKVKPALIEAKLVDKKQLTHDVIELHFQSEPPFLFEPGQFVSIYVPGKGPGGRDLRRAYSIASEPEKVTQKGTFELCVKLVEGGPGTQYLNSLQIGDKMKGMAPYGDFVYKTKEPRHVIMVATGTGIAPFRSMIFSKSYAQNKPLSTKLLFGARESKDLLYVDECVNQLGKDGFAIALSQCKSPEVECLKGRVTDWLRANAASLDWKNTEFYLCGNGAMITEVKGILADHGVEKALIHQEVYYK